MNYIQYLNELLEYIKSYGELPKDNIINFNNLCLSLYNEPHLNEDQIQILDLVLKICNIAYENTSFVLIDDEFYDQLVEKYKQYRSSFQIGAQNIKIPEVRNKRRSPLIYTDEVKYPLIYEDLDKDEMLYYDQLSDGGKITKEDLIKQTYDTSGIISKRTVDATQLYPELVGTLDKCKFVLNQQAKDRGVYGDSNVKIFERDFIGKHIQQGIINTTSNYTLVAELKYDGVSICAEIVNGDTISSARTRGDVNENIAADLTPIFAGYKFNNFGTTTNKDLLKPFGMKFEAIMTKYNLYRYNQMKGKTYANGRTAIIGLLNSSDAYLYRDLITLIPIESSITNNMSRIIEISYLNDMYRAPEINRHAILRGNYIELLFKVKRFVEEAEMMRDYIPYMYDGVVISYDEPEIRQQLGRENSVNKYSMAIKFNALKKSTLFTGYTFTVGQEGTITPMIHFNPVSFFGSIHDKSSGHSYARFKELQLRIGDVVDVEYTNDVMAYVTKPDNSHNATNNNPIIQFPTHCPSCGTELVISKSGKNIKCPNMECPERNLRRVDNMFSKLNIKDFSEAYIKQVGKYTLRELFKLTREDVAFLGEINSQKFINNLKDLQTKEIFDYKIVGALGFTNIAAEKWKLIFSKISFTDFLCAIELADLDKLREYLVSIKGIGNETVDTIYNEFAFFEGDLYCILSMKNVKSYYDELCSLNPKKIRFTGVRDRELMNKLLDMGHNVSDGDVTKDTDILIVPYLNYTSKKTNKVINNDLNTIIVPIDEFTRNMDHYLK